MTKLGDELRKLMAAKLDISEHLGLLRGLACHPDVNKIVEFGFRGPAVSTVALCSAGKPVDSYDPDTRCRPHAIAFMAIAPNFAFINRSSLAQDIGLCDLLFIDSHHTYKHLMDELNTHSISVCKYIVVHDTTRFAHAGTAETKNGSKGLWDAIEEFLAANKDWKLLLRLTNNNGLTVLERSTTPSPGTTTA